MTGRERSTTNLIGELYANNVLEVVMATDITAELASFQETQEVLDVEITALV